MFISIVMAMICLGTQAYDFTAGGLCYRITDQVNYKVAVTRGEVKYQGNVIIPSTISFNGQTYSVETIDESTFNECKDLTSLTIPNSVIQIGAYMCSQCTALQSVVFGNGLKSIARYAFSGCSAIQEITLSSNIETISENAFEYCTNLSSVHLDDNLVTIGTSAFEMCKNLKSISVSSKVRRINKWAFKDCINLENVKLQDGITMMGDEVFNGCEKLSAIVIPNSVLEMGGFFFYGCKSLTVVKIGNGVIRIPRYAFADCKRLSTVTLGSGVQELGENIFNDCKALSSITILNPTPPSMYPESDTWHYPFYNQDATLFVPQTGLEAYKNDAEWKKFNIKTYEGISYLTIRQGQGGVLKERIKIGEAYNYTVVPNEGWRIHSVTFNGSDVTAQMIDNSYTTPALTESAVLSVAFEIIPDDVQAIRANQIMVRTDGYNITVNGLTSGEPVSIYTSDGVLRYQSISNGTELRIPISGTGVYIVKTPEKTVKLAM